MDVSRGRQRGSERKMLLKSFPKRQNQVSRSFPPDLPEPLTHKWVRSEPWRSLKVFLCGEPLQLTQHRRHLTAWLPKSKKNQRRRSMPRNYAWTNPQLWAESTEMKWVTYYIRRTSNYKMMCGCFVGHVQVRHWVSGGELWEKICSVNQDKLGHWIHSHLIPLGKKPKGNSPLVLSCWSISFICIPGGLQWWRHVIHLLLLNPLHLSAQSETSSVVSTAQSDNMSAWKWAARWQPDPIQGVHVKKTL